MGGELPSSKGRLDCCQRPTIGLGGVGGFASTAASFVSGDGEVMVIISVLINWNPHLPACASFPLSSSADMFPRGPSEGQCNTAIMEKKAACSWEVGSSGTVW